MKAYLVLENGMVFEGRAIGCWPDSDAEAAVGELVFTTGMTGYLETLTDPSYAGQIIMQTFPMIGNYGVISQDFEGKSFAKGYVVHELIDTPSNFRSEGKLDAFLKEQGIPGICGVDTRALTRLIRENGVMNACLYQSSEFKVQSANMPGLPERIREYQVKNVVAEVSTKEVLEFGPGSPTSAACSCAEGETLHVVLIDYGAKRNIIRCLVKRGCRVTVVPHDTTAEEILALKPDGVMLSNGPGDPAENVFEVQQIAKLVGKLPVFGICLGHQLTALAMGGKTYKLKYGHRGANQPVTDGKRTWITTQNHGYAVESESMKGTAQLSFRNANDQSCEGLEYPGKRCFTVQFHPEACAGPHDTEFLFDRFLRMMRGEEA
ncbi:MAG: glutamine-hydrolyzing carbamoyl-phosphate synthase small subunit [Oscillospiraceae bacterium]|nr:glutamine-hydrolyzing carbamoyl-phosphate synthase small subunit [Oscillospiraceae bacterium]